MVALNFTIFPKDPGETRDLSDENPELANKPHLQFKKWLKENVAARYWPGRGENVPAEDAGARFPAAT
jgi:hypothetical protein